ncbi:MAG: hypothetical protein ACE5OZ_01160 [Candidatus Heimdallarchaeota archaeon]
MLPDPQDTTDQLSDLPERVPEFESKEYRYPTDMHYPKRVGRWYNGSLMGRGGRDRELYGVNGRLRQLDVNLRSRDTSGRQERESLYRLVGDLLARFFPVTVLDMVVEEILALPKTRLPHSWDQAVSVVLAGMELYLRKTKRRTLRQHVIAKIATALGLTLDAKKLTTAKLYLLRAGFWKDAQYEIIMSTYDVLRNLTLDLMIELSLPVQDDPVHSQRQVYQECMRLISALEKLRRRPQQLEVYAHAIVSVAVETILGTTYNTSKQLNDPELHQRVGRAKWQFREWLKTPPECVRPVLLLPLNTYYEEFRGRISTATSGPLAPALVHVAWGRALRFEMIGDLFEAQSDEVARPPLAGFWLTFILLHFTEHVKLLEKREATGASFAIKNVLFWFSDDSGPGPPRGVVRTRSTIVLTCFSISQP